MIENLVVLGEKRLQAGVRRLTQTEVVKSAALAAMTTALLCCPRLLLWSTRSLPLWYLVATLFLGSFVLWAFVFAWHTEYTGRPVFTLKIEPSLLAIVTVTGVATGLGLHFFLDPIQRLRTPDDYPKTYDLWIAKLFFALAFLQLFLTFAPFAWLVRLIRNQPAAILLTLLFGVIVLSLKSHTSPNPAPTPLFITLVITRITMGFLSLWFYLRGGLILAWWWGFLIEARHLLSL